MQIQTTRFGALTINDKDLISVSDGILGFANLKTFVILEDPDDLIFAWFQSCERPEVAFPILEPELFMSDYNARLNKSDRESLQMEPGNSTRVFTIVTIPEDITQMTANLKAPIVVNTQKRVAKQVVTQENDHPIKYPIFSELKQRVSQVVARPETARAPNVVAVKINRKSSDAMV